jgi:hypothetical protein
MSLVRPENVEVWLARQARELASGFSPLFHGTRYLNSILSDGYLKPTGNPEAVRFTRSADAAAYWATMERGEGEDGRGAILVFDRHRLNARYRLELIDNSYRIAEQEEFVLGRDVPLGLALVGIISEQFPNRPREIRHDAWHWRTHGVGIIPWKPSKKISIRSDNIPRRQQVR